MENKFEIIELSRRKIADLEAKVKALQSDLVAQQGYVCRLTDQIAAAQARAAEAFNEGVEKVHGVVQYHISKYWLRMYSGLDPNYLYEQIEACKRTAPEPAPRPQQEEDVWRCSCIWHTDGDPRCAIKAPEPAGEETKR